MKHYEDKVVPASVQKVVAGTTCDVCNSVIPPEALFEKRETTVSHKEGSVYPEGGDYEETSFDLCDVCWGTKLVPFLESLGAVKQVKEIDW